jgi:hypothetical protein
MKVAISKLSAASPDMDPDELAALEADIRKHGQLVPILLRGLKVIDGRKRLAACRAIGIEPKTMQIGTADPVQIARSANLLRTHYTTGQRADYAAELATATKADAARRAKRCHKMAAEYESDSQLRVALPVTVAEAAAVCDVHPATVEKAKRLRRKAAPEVSAAVRAGLLSLHAASQLAATTPKGEQAEAVRLATEPAPAGSAPRLRRPAYRPPSLIVERCLDSIENVLAILGEKWIEAEARNNANRPEWIARIKRYRRILGHLDLTDDEKAAS